MTPLKKIFFFIILIFFISGCNFGYISYETSNPLPKAELNDKLGFATHFTISGVNTLEVGVCTRFLIQATNSSGQSRPVVQDVPLGLNIIGNATVLFYESNDCSTNSNLIYIRKGESEKEIWVKAISSSNFTLSINTTNEEIITKVNTISINVERHPQKLALIKSSKVEGGFCSSNFQIELQDALGEPYIGTNTKLNMLGKGNGAFYFDSECKKPIPSTYNLNGSSLNFYYLNNSIENLTFSFETSDITPLILPVSVSQRVYSLNVEAPESPILLGECSGAITIYSKDSEQNIFGPISNVSLSTTTSGSFYLNSNCSGSSVSTVNIPQIGSINIYFKPTATTSPTTITASHQDVPNSGSKVIAIQRDPRMLSFKTAPTNAGGGRCSSIFTVEVKDKLGNTFNNKTFTANLSNTGQGKFYEDSLCSLEITSLSFDASQTQKSFYFKDSKIENLTITVSVEASPSIESAIKHFEIIQVVDRFEISGPDTILLGECSGAITIYSKDSEGNIFGPISNVSLSTTTSGSFYLNSNCSGSSVSTVNIPQIGSINIYFKPTATTSPTTITASHQDVPNDGSKVITIQRDPRMLFFTQYPSNIGAGACSSLFELSVKDKLGNIFNNKTFTVNLSKTGQGNFYEDSSCSLEITSLSFDASQTQKSFYFKDELPEDITITADAGIQDPPISQTSVQVSILLTDSTFGTNGLKKISIGSSAKGTGILKHIGKYYISATSTTILGNNKISLVRLNDNGTTEWIKTPTLTDFTHTYANSMILQGSKILIAGTAITTDGIEQFFVVRFNEDGSIDNTFGPIDPISLNQPGYVVSSFINNAQGKAIGLLNNGNIVATGNVINGTNSDFGLFIWNSDGSEAILSNSIINFGTNKNELTAMKISNDLIYLAGKAKYNSNDDFVIVRVDSNGNLDTSFNSTGIKYIDFNNNDIANAIELDLANNIIIVGNINIGSSNQDIGLVKLSSNGSTELIKRAFNFTNNDNAYSLLINSSGMLYVAGCELNYSYDASIFRLSSLEATTVDYHKTFDQTSGKSDAFFKGMIDGEKTLWVGKSDNKISVMRLLR